MVAGGRQGEEFVAVTIYWQFFPLLFVIVLNIDKTNKGLKTTMTEVNLSKAVRTGIEWDEIIGHYSQHICCL